MQVAGQEWEEGTKRSCQWARPSLGSGPSLYSALLSFALPESSSPGCACRRATQAQVPVPLDPSSLEDGDGRRSMGVRGGRSHTHSLSVLRGIFLGTLRSASP